MSGPKFLLAQAAPYRRQIAAISVLTVLEAGFMLAIPWLAGQVLGGVLADESGLAKGGLGGLSLSLSVGLLVAVLLATTGLTIVTAIFSAATSGRILADLRVKIHAHIQHLPMAFHDRSRSGDLLVLTTFEVSNLSEFLASTVARAPSMLLTAAGSVVLLFLIDPMLALVIPLLLPVFTILAKLAGRRLRRLGETARQAQGEMFSLAEQQLDMLGATRAFAVEQLQEGRFGETVATSRQLQFRHAKLNALLGPVVGLLAALAAIAILLAAGTASGEQRSAAELFSFLLYAALLTRPVGALANMYGHYQWTSGTLARMEVVLAEPVEPGLRATGLLATGAAQAAGAIRFEGVTFAYPGREPVLRQFDLAISPGQIVALTGENGVGKSTAINLLLRFYDPAAGRILLDGQDIAGLQVQHLRRQFGVVPQRALLFDGSVHDNIAFGVPDARQAQIEAAARLAQAHDFISALPQGYATQIGDEGVRLSGGQRQRIALARALLADPPILIFDEATSMFDLEAESAFVDACQTALKGRTVIIVTHRPASLALADRVVRIEGGGAQETQTRA